MLGKIAGMISEMRARSDEGHLPVSEQMREMFTLWRINKIGPGYYMKVGLWRRDIPWADKLDYVLEREYIRRLKLRNPILYHIMTKNKFADKAIRTLFHIPTPDYWGLYHPRRGHDFEGKPLCNAEDIERVIRRKAFGRFCIKSLEEYGGAGFVAVESQEQDGRLMCRKIENATWQPLSAFCRDHLNDTGVHGVLIEQYIKQHPWYKAVNPTSVNTLRIYTVWYDDKKEPEVIGGIFRFGRAGSAVDNTEAGGMYAGIDPETGRLGSLRSKTSFTKSVGPSHPDSGVKLEGEILPRWDEAKALATDAIKCIFGMRAIGFDVAFSVDGPLIVEASERANYLGLVATGIPPGRFARATSKP